MKTKIKINHTRDNIILARKASPVNTEEYINGRIVTITKAIVTPDQCMRVYGLTEYKVLQVELEVTYPRPLELGYPQLRS